MPIFATSNHTTRLITPPPTTIQQNAATTLALTMAALCESNARCSAQSYVLPDGTSPTKAKTFMEYMQEHTSTGFASAFHSGKLKDWETHKTKFTSLANEFLEREVLLPPHQRTRNPPHPPPPTLPCCRWVHVAPQCILLLLLRRRSHSSSFHQSRPGRRLARGPRCASRAASRWIPATTGLPPRGGG